MELFKRKFMLSPSEISTLENAYEASLIGMDRHQCRLMVEEMMKNRSVVSYPDSPCVFDGEYIKTVTSKQLSIIHGNDNIRMLLQFMFSRVGQSEKVEKVYLKIQPDNSIVMDALSTLLSNHDKQFIAYHTFMLYRNETLSFKTPLATNLSILKPVLTRIIPIDTRMRYRPAYFYAQYCESSSTFFTDSARIVTKDFAMLIFNDGERAVFITEPEMIDIYVEMMGRLHDRSSPLTQIVNITKQASAALISKVNILGEVNIFPEPLFFFARAVVFAENKREASDSLDSDVLKGIRVSSLESIRTGKAAYSYFSMDGLQKLVETGLFSDLNERLMHPMSSEQIRNYLCEILSFAKKHENIVPLLSEHEELSIYKNINMRIYEDTEIWMIYMGSGPNFLISINENSIVKAFSDYYFNYLPQRLLPDCKEKALNAIQSAVNNLPIDKNGC